MLIVAGWLDVAAADRDAYVTATRPITEHARTSTGCLDFVQAPDPADPERILVYERWASAEDLDRFRASAGPEPDLPELLRADVRRYRIAAVEPA
ncbi:putative quinol monooxygenase [Georgenia deserti]|uniref:Quinol monooxygenase n=1 Tax=Georgenia deserti TaxID=2093781 RepID=A0ABW4L4B3_9MICO